jgi:hypothetical protein
MHSTSSVNTLTYSGITLLIVHHITLDIHMQILPDVCMNTTKDGVRITIALDDEQKELLDQLSTALDVDQGKSIRWMINTLSEMSRLCSEIPECRSKLNPQAKYMLDTLSSITS